MTFARFALILVLVMIAHFSAMEFVSKGESLTPYSAGVVVGGVMLVAGSTLVVVGALLLVRRALRGTSN